MEDKVLGLVFDLFHSLDVSIDLANVLPHQRIAFAHLQPDILEHDVESGIDRCIYLCLGIRLREKRFECFHVGGWMDKGVGNARADDAAAKMAKWRSRTRVEVQVRYSTVIYMWELINPLSRP